MMWLAVMGACWLGAVALSGDDKKSSSTHVNHDVVSNTRKYTVQYVRENLDEWYYSNWDCEQIAYQLQDNWLRDDMDKMLKRGYKFYEAINKLRADGKLDI